MDFAFSLVAGWIFYLVRVVPQITWNWSGFVTALVCLVASRLRPAMVSRLVLQATAKQDGATFDAQGRMLYGWQTQLLPFLEQDDLYRRINQKVPWTDADNAPPFGKEWRHI